jgi:hypothetical protein
MLGASSLIPDTEQPVPLPKPIRYDRNTWVCMRNDPILPKAIIRRVTLRNTATGMTADRFRVVTWSLDPGDRTLVGYYETLTEANAAVLYTRPHGGPDGPANGLRAEPRT